MNGGGRLGRWSLAGQLLVLQVTIVGLLVAVGALLAYLDVADRTEDSTRDEVVAVALTIADSPIVADAVAGDNPSAMLQPFAERIRHDTGVDFVTIMDPHGRRYTHPDPARIGQQFLGHTAEALAGHTFTETYTGTLGPSVRAVAPVFDGDRRIVALVSVGITLDAIAGQVRDRLVPLAIIALVVLAAGLAGTYLVNRRLAKRTRGLGAAELTTRIEYHEQILHTVREGLLLIDQDGRVTLCNDAASELLDLTGDVEGRALADLGLPPAMADSFGRVTRDEIQLTERRVLVVNSAPVRPHGTVVTLRDHTDLQALTGELNSVRVRRVAALAGARGGEPAAHRRLAGGAGPHRGGRRVRHGRAGACPAADRPRRRRGVRAGARRAAAGQGGRGQTSAVPSS